MARAGRCRSGLAGATYRADLDRTRRDGIRRLSAAAGLSVPQALPKAGGQTGRSGAGDAPDLAYDLFAEAALHDLADLGDRTIDGSLTADEVRYEPPDADLSATVELTHQGDPVRLTGREPLVRPMPAMPVHGPGPSSPPRPPQPPALTVADTFLVDGEYEVDHGKEGRLGGALPVKGAHPCQAMLRTYLTGRSPTST